MPTNTRSSDTPAPPPVERPHCPACLGANVPHTIECRRMYAIVGSNGAHHWVSLDYLNGADLREWDASRAHKRNAPHRIVEYIPADVADAAATVRHRALLAACDAALAKLDHHWVHTDGCGFDFAHETEKLRSAIALARPNADKETDQ